ncbi:MAG: nuclear transport factor 2 family protein [Rhodocyclaceae bacterium]|jgi:hypothetical protein|nr:nuclear transport factor 2 family protein [Rhodocyclaceae bacterium]
MTATTPSDLAAAVGELAAREAIRDVIYRYCHGIDRRDWAVLNGVFWPDSKLEYGLYNDSGAGFATVIEQLFGGIGMGVTMHFIGNCILRVNGASADGETYVHALHQVPQPDGRQADLVIGARYLDSFACRNGEWRIALRKVVFDWVRDYGDSGDWAVGAFGITAATAHIGKPGVVERPAFSAALR